MAKSSLPPVSGKCQKAPTPAVVTPASSTSQLVLNKITLLSSQLPPTVNTSNLNPLADLLSLFTALPLRSTAKGAALEAERRIIITSLLALKTVFEALITKGRLHGVLKSNKKTKLDEDEDKEVTSVEQVKEWLKSRYEEYCQRLAEVMTGHWDATIRVRVLTCHS